MGKNKRKGIIIILTTIILIGIIPVSSSATELDAAKQQREDLEQKKADINNKIGELEKEKGNILNYIEKLDTELNQLTVEINTLTAEIDQAEKDLEVAKAELEDAKEREAKQYESMQKRIKYIYEEDEPSFLDVLLDSKSISDLLNQVEIRSKISEYDKNMYDEYIKVTEEVLEKEQALEVNVSNLKIMEEELLYEQEAVEILVQEKSKELTSREDELLAAEIVANEYDAELAEKLKEIEHLEEEERKKAEEELRQRQEEERKRKEAEERQRIAKIRAEEAAAEAQAAAEAAAQAAAAQAAAQTANQSKSNNTSQPTQPSKPSQPAQPSQPSQPSQGSGGAFVWPTSGRITSTFGYRSNPFGTGGSEFHGGIDIAANYGTPIKAAASGTVTSAGYGTGNGNYIYINHGNGLVTKYLHASSLAVSAGTYVNQGDTIAYVGSTGRSTGNHLHFQVEVYGTAVNPYNYLK